MVSIGDDLRENVRRAFMTDPRATTTESALFTALRLHACGLVDICNGLYGYSVGGCNRYECTIGIQGIAKVATAFALHVETQLSGTMQHERKDETTALLRKFIETNKRMAARVQKCFKQNNLPVVVQHRYPEIWLDSNALHLLHMGALSCSKLLQESPGVFVLCES